MPSLAEEIRSDRRDACRIPDKLTPSQWAEQNRVLTAAVSAEPGNWRNDRTPYLVGIMDSVCEPGVEETVFVKPTQVGGSETLRNVLGWEIEEDPGPCLYVMPTEASVKEALEERIKPLLESSPTLKRHVSSDPHDITQSAVKLDTMAVYFGWSNSPQSLATRPCRRVKFDECDKYPQFAGKEADPMSLGEERTATYGHRRHKFKVSTPTTREGHIWRAWEACGDKRRYFVPCPHCGHEQLLAFAQIKWPKDVEGAADKVRLADKIEQDRLAWYECANPNCRGVIRDHHKPKMLNRGKWVSEGQKSKRVGFHLNAIYSPWRSFSDVAAQFIRADGDPGATMNFRNSWLAEPFEQQVSKREPSAIRQKEETAKQLGIAGQMRIVPAWSVYLHAICDVQKDHCYYAVIAWGYELQSKRVAVGTAATLDEVYRNVFAPDVPFMAEGGGPVQVAELIVDSGFRKDEVTEFARKDPRRVHLSKGLSTYFGPIAEQKVERASGVIVWNVNTKQSKDTLDRLIGDPDPMKWQTFVGIGDDYCHQMASEHKVLDPHTKQEVWQKKSSGAANHYWDIEAVAAAVATARGAGMPKPAPSPSQPTTSRDAESSNPLNYHGRW